MYNSYNIHVKYIIIKIKTTFGHPLLPIKHPHKTPTSDKSQGGGGGPTVPPLNPRMRRGTVSIMPLFLPFY